MSITSPCIKVCFVDPDAKLCIGCFRTLPELAQWTKLSDADRDAITMALPARRENYRAGKTA
jgi:predicted Fe-S protein YdhL (DUF1289 family)